MIRKPLRHNAARLNAYAPTIAFPRPSTCAQSDALHTREGDTIGMRLNDESLRRLQEFEISLANGRPQHGQVFQRITPWRDSFPPFLDDPTAIHQLLQHSAAQALLELHEEFGESGAGRPCDSLASTAQHPKSGLEFMGRLIITINIV